MLSKQWYRHPIIGVLVVFFGDEELPYLVGGPVNEETKAGYGLINRV